MDLLKNKFILLELVTELTAGIVNGKKLEVSSAFKDNSSSSAKSPVQITRASPPEKGDNTWDNSSDARASKSRLGTEEAQQPKHYGPRDLKNMKGWPFFQEIFMLAALHGEEVDTLKVTVV